MLTVTLYTRPDCSLCDQVKVDLESLQVDVPHELSIVNIENNPDFQNMYLTEIPVVQVGPYTLKAPISRQALNVTLRAARDRLHQIDNLQKSENDRMLTLDWKVTRTDRFSYWLSKHYMLVFNLVVMLYLGIPFLAPVFMKLGWEAPAGIIYRVYGTMCHQLAFRSWFLFGEQPAYPRSAANVAGLIPYGQATGLDENDQWAAREFRGNPVIGFKVALCERDIGIYAGILLFGLVYVITRHRIKSLSWYLWIIIGILPIAIDGVSQLITQPPFSDVLRLSFLGYRESTPLLRTITGLLFGITTAWFGFPVTENNMRDSREFIEKKLKYIKISKQKDQGQAG
jgi:uncharacterized membrane protein